ncbi:MAG TPA: site-specific DNA-methyltransferase [Syntrophobacteraceae bacterium]|nr:site-specific DNA-methyltransferase [Syntrophobacteraceae bacterium]
MSGSDFFKALGIEEGDRGAVKRFAEVSRVPVDRLRHYHAANILPSGPDRDRVCAAAGISPAELMLRMGVLDGRILAALRSKAREVFELLRDDLEDSSGPLEPPPVVYKTDLGKLHHGDCLALMKHLEDESVDLVFADPPFNLKKLYPSGVNDDLKEAKYLEWCESWAAECVRLLKPGGSLFFWNIPRWNTYLAGYLNARLTFRHWIAVDIKYSLPIRGRLYPSHYSLLYFCKGEKPKTFRPDRLPMEVCPACKADLRDYGGYKDKMNPRGVNLTDVWTDIAPVRHSKYKMHRGSNELPVKLMDRILEMASEEGDLVFDPFGGSGTTYVVAEIKRRRWIGIELGPMDDIVRRLEQIRTDANLVGKIRRGYNRLFTEETLHARKQLGLWTCDSVGKTKGETP